MYVDALWLIGTAAIRTCFFLLRHGAHRKFPRRPYWLLPVSFFIKGFLSLVAILTFALLPSYCYLQLVWGKQTLYSTFLFRAGGYLSWGVEKACVQLKVLHQQEIVRSCRNRRKTRDVKLLDVELDLRFSGDDILMLVSHRLAGEICTLSVSLVNFCEKWQKSSVLVVGVTVGRPGRGLFRN